MSETLLVVESQERGLSGGAEPAAGEPMSRVALQFDGPAVAVLDEHPAPRAAAPTRGSIEIRPAGNDLFHRAETGHGVLYRGTLTTRPSRGGEGESRNLQELATAKAARAVVCHHQRQGCASGAACVQAMCLWHLRKSHSLSPNQ